MVPENKIYRVCEEYISIWQIRKNSVQFLCGTNYFDFKLIKERINERWLDKFKTSYIILRFISRQITICVCI